MKNLEFKDVIIIILSVLILTFIILLIKFNSDINELKTITINNKIRNYDSLVVLLKEEISKNRDSVIIKESQIKYYEKEVQNYENEIQNINSVDSLISEYWKTRLWSTHNRIFGF